MDIEENSNKLIAVVFEESTNRVIEVGLISETALGQLHSIVLDNPFGKGTYGVGFSLHQAGISVDRSPGVVKVRLKSFCSSCTCSIGISCFTQSERELDYRQSGGFVPLVIQYGKTGEFEMMKLVGQVELTRLKTSLLCNGVSYSLKVNCRSSAILIVLD